MIKLNNQDWTLQMLAFLGLVLFQNPTFANEKPKKDRKNTSVFAASTQQAFGSNTYNFNPGIVPVYPDFVYDVRIKEIQSDIDLVYNNYVREFIEIYTVNRRDISEQALKYAPIYFPMFDELLGQAGLPKALKYLSVAESGLKPNAVSSADATGLWQFIYGTGQMYGLEDDYYVDQRRDPYLATKAAIEHMKDLYELYNDWYLVFAAYNCGAGNVNKAIRRAGGGKKTYWEIRRYLPEETRGYVPSFIAACYMMNYSDEHNLHPSLSIVLPENVGYTTVNGPLSFAQISKQTGVPVQTLTLLNPGFKKNFVPKSNKNYSLYMPQEGLNSFISSKSRIVNLSKNDQPASPKEEKSVEPDVTFQIPAAKEGYAYVQYTVKPGENLLRIASIFDADMEEIKTWNGKKSSLVSIDEILHIQVPKEDVNTYLAKIKSPQKTTTKTESFKKTEQKYYTVKSGDTLFSVARRMNVTLQDLLRYNNLKENASLRPGMRLKLTPQ